MLVLSLDCKLQSLDYIYAGHEVENLVQQLKVRILELLLKMQPKLKVKLSQQCLASFAHTQAMSQQL